MFFGGGVLAPFHIDWSLLKFGVTPFETTTPVLASYRGCWSRFTLHEPCSAKRDPTRHYGRFDLESWNRQLFSRSQRRRTFRPGDLFRAKAKFLMAVMARVEE